MKDSRSSSVARARATDEGPLSLFAFGGVMPVERRRVYLPAQWMMGGKVHGNSIRQLLRPEIDEEVDVQVEEGNPPVGPFTISHSGGRTKVVNRSGGHHLDADEILYDRDGAIFHDPKSFQSGGPFAHWVRPRSENLKTKSAAESQAHCETTRSTWINAFKFSPEVSADGRFPKPGLRPPQIGALHAILAHWTITEQPATIVMPTGTGKTETMLALLVSQRIQRLLVIVPTSALREQVAGKFLSLGLLKQFDVVSPDAHYPVVGVMKHKPKTTQDAEDFFLRCNVVITTMNIASGCTPSIQKRMAELSSHLFIDEAHHIAARTWEAFRGQFNGKPIVQFTATPFRTDGKVVDGKVVFNYPLRKAQAEGYFKSINFRAVNEFSPDRANQAIAATALDQLASDLRDGYDHILMARASTIPRARALLEIYRTASASHEVVLIHSDIAEDERREALRKLRAREARVVICVDMLGEGFDLPSLKIAALHDMHKSLTITLQFTGRFTRTSESIGDATIVANVADPKVEECLRELYAEDADWNAILRRLSEGATGRQIRRSDFIEGFTDKPEEVPLQNIFPKMSTVTYRTTCRTWRPDRAGNRLGNAKIYAGPTINAAEKVMLFVTHETEAVPWGEVKGLQNSTWHLYLVHWSSEQNLLFINSSNNHGAHENLAKAIAGDDATLIRGESIFRCLNGINRMILMNLGLSHTISRSIRFSMHVGADIKAALADAQMANKIKSNLFGTGYEKGAEATIGCSQKGRVWSYKIAYDMSDWVEWCRHVGAKLIDPSISTAIIFENLMIPEAISDRPPLVPLAIEWPDAFWFKGEDLIHLDFGDGNEVPFFETELEITDHAVEGPMHFSVHHGSKRVNYEIRFANQKVEYVAIGNPGVAMRIGRTTRPLSDWFDQEYPIVRFENGAYLVFDEFVQPPGSAHRIPFDRGRIVAWDWTGVDLKKESQTTAKYSDSIQRRLIERIISPESGLGYEIVFDDDDSGEAADVIGMKVLGDVLQVHLYHCKFSKEATPGARVEDLYAVCGQAQRSVHWKSRVRELIQHMLRRDDTRRNRTGVSRFELGDLQRLREISRRVSFFTTEVKIFVVQPGLSAATAATNQLELLAVTEVYLKETFQIDLGVIASQ